MMMSVDLHESGWFGLTGMFDYVVSELTDYAISLFYSADKSESSILYLYVYVTVNTNQVSKRY
jgi:hypothetical protein